MNQTFIAPLKSQGLTGRVLRMPGPKGSKKEVMFVYGHHSSLERWWGIMQLIATRANVTMPDLPGFGGMQSLYAKGQTASFDNLADWLAGFIEQEYKGKKVTLVGMSLGFVIITRALQRHPKLTGKVDKLISLFGFADSADFKMPARSRFINSLLAKFFSLPVSSSFYRGVFLNPHVLRLGYHKTKNAKQKFAGLTEMQKRENMDFEVQLWRSNDIRTHMHTAAEFLTFKASPLRVALPVHHIAVHNDRYFNGTSVEKHFKQIFSGYKILAELKNGTHAPTAIRTAQEAQVLVPGELLSLL